MVFCFNWCRSSSTIQKEYNCINVLRSVRFILAIFVLCITMPSYAQHRDTHIRFLPSFGDKKVQLEDVCYPLSPLSGGDSVSFETLKCYISGIGFYWGDSLVYKEPGSYHLLDMANERSMMIDIALPVSANYNTIRFNLGIDSITNVSGSQGGDLDPMQGMFWSWQSGYINCKLEGKSNKCHTRNNRFHFHLGGYMSPYNALQQVQLAVKGETNITIAMPLDELFKKIDLSQQNTVMTPGEETVELSKIFAGMFNIKAN